MKLAPRVFEYMPPPHPIKAAVATETVINMSDDIKLMSCRAAPAHELSCCPEILPKHIRSSQSAPILPRAAPVGFPQLQRTDHHGDARHAAPPSKPKKQRPAVLHERNVPIGEVKAVADRGLPRHTAAAFPSAGMAKLADGSRLGGGFNAKPRPKCASPVAVGGGARQRPSVARRDGTVAADELGDDGVGVCASAPSEGEAATFTVGKESVSISDVRALVMIKELSSGPNQWQRTLLSEAFQARLRRRAQLLSCFVDLARSLIVTMDRRVQLLRGVPLFAQISSVGLRALAATMHSRLVGRYQKVQRSLKRPSRFQILVSGALRAADETGGVAELKPGAAFGEAALVIDADAAGEELEPERLIVTTVQASLLLCLHRRQLSSVPAQWLEGLRLGYVTHLSTLRKISLLQLCPALSNATADFRKQLAAMMKYTRLKPGTHLFSAGSTPDAVYLLASGRVRLRASIKGSDTNVCLDVEAPDWVGAGAIFTRSERPWSAEVVSEASELLVLPATSFGEFCDLVPMMLPSMRASEKRLLQLLSDDTAAATNQEETSLPAQQKSARELGYRAQLRLEQQEESMERWQQKQEVSKRASFISSLVPAYTLVDNFGHRVPVKITPVRPMSDKLWWRELSRFRVPQR